MDDQLPLEAPDGQDHIVVPTPEVKAEIEQLILSDTSLLGEVYRNLRDGMTPDQIRESRGAERDRFVWNYQRAHKALLDGDLPTAPKVAQAVSRSFRRLLRLNELSLATQETLETNASVLDARAKRGAVRVLEDQEAQIATEEAEAVAPTGIYVYTLPHYWHYPFDPNSGRTLMKVGRSDRDAVRRFRQQTRTTALPEDPILLRIYETDEDSLTAERLFHELLEAADHDRSTARTGGREWFLTSVKFLDKIADTLKLVTRHVLDPDISD